MIIKRKLEEIRLNTHQQHFEDLVLFGKEGIDEINDKIERFKLKLQDKDSGLNTTTKIDGAPAVVCWHKFKGLPDNSICLKSFMSNNPKVISTLEDIESKYNDRPGMSKMLEYCLELSKYIPSGEAWQGDCLFISNTKKEREINGTDYITFQPNKIIYAFSENNPGYEDVKNAEFGIAFHTIYTGDVENKSQNFNVKAKDLNVPSKFYILSPALNITNKQEFNLNEINNLQIKFNKEADSLKSDRVYNELINNKEFMGYWNTFENSNLADKKATTINVNTFIADLKEYINDKLEKEYNKKLLTLKTDKGKEKALLNKNNSIVRLNDLVENNKQTLTNLVNCLNTAATIKMLMWQGFKKNKTPYDTYYQSKSKGYIQADPEGIAMSDSDGNIVKLVDRTAFSSHNRDDDFTSGFDHNENLDILDGFNLLEAVEDRRAAVVAFGRLNPPTIGHRKLAQTIANEAAQLNAEPLLYISHSQDYNKNPLNYDKKLNWVKQAFGNLVNVVDSNVNNPYQVLHDLYMKGYTDVLYLSGDDRDMSKMLAYNNELNNKLKEKEYYKFDTLAVDSEKLKRFEDENDPTAGASASKARKLVRENNFEEFKKIVPFNEIDAKELFDELKGILTEELLKETPIGVKSATKEIYKKLKPEFQKELSKIGLDAPDENKSLQSYATDTSDYQGLFVKQSTGGTLSFSNKDLDKIAKNDPTIDDNAVYKVDNLVVTTTDKNNNEIKYGIHNSGQSIYTNKGSIRVAFDDTWTTYYQEPIYSLLLINRIPEANKDNFKEWLLNSDPVGENKGIFNYIEYICPPALNDITFKKAWENFINSWYKAFITIINGRENFATVANSLLSKNVDSAIVLHPAVLNGYKNIAKVLLTGRDSFDKSDSYFCVKDLNTITSDMERLGNLSDKSKYINYMAENSDKIIGVSLKKPSGSLKVTNNYNNFTSNNIDVENYFGNEVIWLTNKDHDPHKTQYIRFNTEDGELDLQIRSGGKGRPGVMNFKYKNSSAQKGGAKTVIANLLSSEQDFYNKIINSISYNELDFETSAKSLITYLCGEADPKPGKKYLLTDRGLELITKIFNLSGGSGGEMAPYIFVH